MRNQPFLPAIVRMSALALMVGVAACSDEMLTVPEAVNDIMVVTASAKNGKGVGAANTVFEPQRLNLLAIDAAGVGRRCLVNGYEDLDGDDFVTIRPNVEWAPREEHINEKDGFVLIMEGFEKEGSTVITRTEVTHIGRTTWSAEISYTEAEFTDLTTTYQGKSYSQGVVFPVDLTDGNLVGETGRTAGDLAVELLVWLDQDEDQDPDGSGQPGSWDENGIAVWASSAAKYDLLNDPLGMIPNGPLMGTEGRAVARINELLAHYEARQLLQGVECQAVWWGPMQGAWVPNLDIHLTKSWPKQLNRLF